MKRFLGLASSALMLSVPALAETVYTPKEDIPVGTELFSGDDGHFKGRTPSGEIINIKLDKYDKWWLGKTSEERSEWLDIYSSGIKSGKLQKGVTFVQFMKVVMLKKLSIEHFKNQGK